MENFLLLFNGAVVPKRENGNKVKVKKTTRALKKYMQGYNFTHDLPCLLQLQGSTNKAENSSRSLQHQHSNSNALVPEYIPAPSDYVLFLD